MERKARKLLPFSINILNDPALIVDHDGTIIKVNEAFAHNYKWKTMELVGQDIHIIIPSKFIRKHSHDKLMLRYKYGAQSDIIGKIRIVPIMKPDDNEAISTIQIVPIKYKKKHAFLALTKPIIFDSGLYNKKLEWEKLKRQLMNIDRDYTFDTGNSRNRKVISNVKKIFGSEISILVKFCIENKDTIRIRPMFKHFVLEKPIGDLNILKDLMWRYYTLPEIAYLSLLFHNIMVPMLENSIDDSVIETLSSELSEKISFGDSSSTV
jgi:hypothetical protein